MNRPLPNAETFAELGDALEALLGPKGLIRDED